MTVNRCRTESPVPRKDRKERVGRRSQAAPAVPIRSHFEEGGPFCGDVGFGISKQGTHTPRPPARGRADSFALPERAPITGGILPFRKNLLERRGAPGRTRPACAQAVPIHSHSGPSSPLGPKTRPERLHLPLRSAQIPPASANGRYPQAKSHLIGTNESVDKVRRNRYGICE